MDTRLHRSLTCVDGIVAGYLLGSGLLLVPGVFSGWVYPLCLAIHVVFGVGLVFLSRADTVSPVVRPVRELYPLLLLLLLYGEVDLIVGLWHEGPGYDVLVRQWDLWMFGEHPHVGLARKLTGWIWNEVFHFLYLSYYLLLIGSFVGVWRRRPRLFPRFAFVVTGVFASFVAVFIAFPVAGPLSASDVSMTTRGLFPQIVSHLYAPLAVDGIHAGAFPSSHVGMSVAIVLVLAPTRWVHRIALGALVLGIAFSTVYGGFHYAIDAVTGLVAGALLYVVWNELYRLLQSTPPAAGRDGEGAAERTRPSRAAEGVTSSG